MAVIDWPKAFSLCKSALTRLFKVNKNYIWSGHYNENIKDTFLIEGQNDTLIKISSKIHASNYNTMTKIWPAWVFNHTVINALACIFTLYYFLNVQKTSILAICQIFCFYWKANVKNIKNKQVKLLQSSKRLMKL